MKIAQLGFYGTNTGDSAALYNIRKFFPKDTEWTSIHMESQGSARQPIYEIVNFFLDANVKYDMILVGGAGLVEGGKWNTATTGWKLPFNKQILDIISIPIVVFGVGFNFFRGMEKLNSEGKKNLSLLIDKAKLFSVRNDGSYEELMKAVKPSKYIYEIMDAGGMQDIELPQKSEMKIGCFNPTMNGGQCWDSRNVPLQELVEVIQSHKMKAHTHSPKAYCSAYRELDYIIPKDIFMNNLKEDFQRNIEIYNDVDFIVPMHQHGQLFSFGKNIPYISIASMEKMVNQDKKFGLEDYTVDTSLDNWVSILDEKITRLKTDANYLKRWYDIRTEKIDDIKIAFKHFCKKVIE